MSFISGKTLIIFTMSILIGLNAKALYSLEHDQKAEAKTSFAIYLVRHAEKQSGEDPELTEVGKKRALFYAHFLKDAEITRIYSTDYRRTVQTATPTATALKIELAHYDPRRLAEFAYDLIQARQNVLVVGHSNTTVQLAHLLGVRSANDLPESEFDRIYQLVFDDEELVISNVLRSGKF